MQTTEFVVTNATTGAAMPFALCYVYYTGTTTLVSLYDGNGLAISNPVQAGSNAFITFSVADGVYDVHITSADGTYSFPLWSKVQMVDILSALQAVQGSASSALAYQGNGIGVGGGLYGFYLDSLTDGTGTGTGATNFRQYFTKIARAALGDGGPGYQAFDYGVFLDQGAGFYIGGSDLTYIGIADGIYGQYSLDGKGLYVNGATGSDSFFWVPPSQWTTARFFYLNGIAGSFKWKYTTDPDAALRSVTTIAGTPSLAYIDLVAPTNQSVGIAIEQITGNGCFFGVDWRLNLNGYRPADIAAGGRTLQSVAAQNSAFRQQWYRALSFTQLIFNGGMNDRATRTPTQHYSDIAAIITDIQTASANTAILMVQSLEPADAASSYFQAYTAQKIAACQAFGLSYVDLRNWFGDYATASAAGDMVDTIHPNDATNRKIAQIYADIIGLPLGLHDPGATAFSSAGAGGYYNYTGNLSTKTDVALSAATRQILWKLGLTNGYPCCYLKGVVAAQRNATNAIVVQEFRVALFNATTINQVTSVDSVAATTFYTVNATDNATILFTLDVTLNAATGLAEIGITPTSYSGSVTASCEYRFTSLTISGPSVFEN